MSAQQYADEMNEVDLGETGVTGTTTAQNEDDQPKNNVEGESGEQPPPNNPTPNDNNNNPQPNETAIGGSTEIEQLIGAPVTGNTTGRRSLEKFGKVLSFPFYNFKFPLLSSPLLFPLWQLRWIFFNLKNITSKTITSNNSLTP